MTNSSANSDNACGPISESQLARLVFDLAGGNRPWQAVLAEARFGVGEEVSRWLSNTQRSAFFRLMAPPNEKTFLAIGDESGIISACLAQDYDRGVLIEARSLVSEFLRHRFRLDSVQNVAVVQDLPSARSLSKDSVDFVVIDGLSASVPLSRSSQSSREDQLNLLREMHLRLRPGGRIVISVENSWNIQRRLDTLRLLKGHIRQFEFSPRILSNLAYRMTHIGRQRGGTRNYFGYKRLMRAAGFENTRVFVVLPDPHLPIDIYSCDARALAVYYSKYYVRSRVGRWLQKLSTAAGMTFPLAYLESSFYLVADR